MPGPAEDCQDKPIALAAAGGLGGLIATLPMSAWMLVVQRFLPRRHRGPLPPERITVRMVSGRGPLQRLPQPWRGLLTVGGHFGYGLACGVLYAPLAQQLPGAPVLRGAGFGLLVWAASYLGWLPAAGILALPDKRSTSLHVLMASAHVIWGAVLGGLADRLAWVWRKRQQRVAARPAGGARVRPQAPAAP